MPISEKCMKGVSSRRRWRRRPSGRAGRAGPTGKSRINQSRWFDPTVGTWLSEDPSGVTQRLNTQNQFTGASEPPLDFGSQVLWTYDSTHTQNKLELGVLLKSQQKKPMKVGSR